jgi:tryptophan synthase alpha chain
VSMTGVTGSASSGTTDAREAGGRAADLRAGLGLPVVVGFGIDSPEKAAAAAGPGRADGVVVGSAIVRAIEGGRTPDARAGAVDRLVRDLRQGLDAG